MHPTRWVKIFIMETRRKITAILFFFLLTYLTYLLMGRGFWGLLVGAVAASFFIKWMVLPLFEKNKKDSDLLR